MVGKGKQELGPRGGHTTRQHSQVKKTVWLNADEAVALRKAAYDEYRSEASIVREALRRFLAIED